MKKIFILFLIFLSLPLLAKEWQWSLNRQRSRLTLREGDASGRISVAAEYNPELTAAQWSFSSPLFRVGGISRSGFISFFDNRNLSSETKRNNVGDGWVANRSSSTIGLSSLWEGKTSVGGLYAARPTDGLVIGGTFRWQASERLSLLGGGEWWGGAPHQESQSWYYSETKSRDQELLRGVTGFRWKMVGGHDAGVYLSLTASNINPLSAAALFIYEYQSPLREFLFKTSIYGRNYLFKTQNLADRFAVCFFSYKEKFQREGSLRIRLGVEIPPLPDLYYIFPFESSFEIRGEYKKKGWRLFLEDQISYGWDKEGDKNLKNRASATLSWQGLVSPQSAFGITLNGRCTYDLLQSLTYKAELRVLFLHQRQSFALTASVQEKETFTLGGEMTFRFESVNLVLSPKWQWNEGLPSGGLETSLKLTL